MRYLLAILLFLCAAPAAFAQPAKNAPVEISADKSLEWNRKAKTYTARGAAVAKQGATEVASDTLVAEYRDANGGTDIHRLTANGHVTIKSPPYIATGDKAVYDLGDGTAVMTGENLQIVTEGETLTARDSITFSANDNRLTANGEAVAVRGTDTLKADVLNAFFQKNAAGDMVLQKMTADGHVSIKTVKETVTGDNGVYDVLSGKAVLTGKILIQQGASRIEGTRAVVDLKTGISQLFAESNAATEGRVKGVFYPKATPAP
jgi:lipopolysaccharide export system protein LptA